MKKGIKTLAMWLIIGVIVIVLLSSIMENSSSKMTYSELITSIENSDVESVTISSSGVMATVKLKSSKSEKEVSLPSVDSFMEYIEEDLKAGEFTLDEEKNNTRGEIQEISTEESRVKVYVIPTNEELMIARDTAKLVK